MTFLLESSCLAEQELIDRLIKLTTLDFPRTTAVRFQRIVSLIGWYTKMVIADARCYDTRKLNNMMEVNGYIKIILEEMP